ncbi:hypothetical protein BV378_15380 [Nostoc sp. RF31YmG]|nr:hypothetical protein BV378_15380 [Nostoc sp. RF31YmG]
MYIPATETPIERTKRKQQEFYSGILNGIPSKESFQVAYEYLGRAKDATFELTHAILLTRNIYSLADLSLSG